LLTMQKSLEQINTILVDWKWIKNLK
jgi:hypothetical protein